MTLHEDRAFLDALGKRLETLRYGQDGEFKEIVQSLNMAVQCADESRVIPLQFNSAYHEFQKEIGSDKYGEPYCVLPSRVKLAQRVLSLLMNPETAVEASGASKPFKPSN
jgi:hypothetical protein